MEKIALVTGGTRGIGAAISIALKDAGYTVAANYHKDDETAKKFSADTGIPVFSWDVSDYIACEKGITEVCCNLGSSIDILVNNAGITKDAMLHRMDVSAWNNVICTNLSSLFNMCRLTIVPMRDKKFGRIINISSINGLKGQVGQVNYSAAKAGIIGFTKALALESANRGITVNAIAPGYTATDMTEKIKEDVLAKIVSTIPLGRLGNTEEIAHTAAFLASEKSAYITGAVININGAQYT